MSRQVAAGANVILSLRFSIPNVFSCGVQPPYENTVLRLPYRSDLPLTRLPRSLPLPVKASILLITVSGEDLPGIVREIFNAIAELGLNVESLSTRTEAAADSGTLLFRADAQLSTPEPLPIETIRETVENLAHDLYVDISVRQPD